MKPISIDNASPQVREHVISRLADITSEYITRLEDLCTLNNIDKNEFLFLAAHSIVPYTKAHITLNLAENHSLPPEAALALALESSGIDIDDFLKFMEEKNNDKGS